MNNALKKLAFIGAGAILAVSSFFTHAAAIKTDVIFVVDESGSMGTVQANLRNNIGLFASILSAGGVDGSYGLVGYGDSGVAPNTLTDLTDPMSFATAAAGLVASGGIEPAYDAVAYALNETNAYNAGGSFSFRNDAITNIILLTDEPHRSSATSWASTDSFLKANNALFNLVATSSAANFVINGGNLLGLAQANGGQLFDLAGFNSSDSSVVESFVETFALAKLQETLDFCAANPNDPACVNTTPVPEPRALLALIVGIFLVRRLAKK